MWRLALLLVVLAAAPAWALTATSTCTAATGWATTPTNALALDGAFAQTAATGQPLLQVTTCAMGLPTGATVQGIQVRVVNCGAGTSGQRAVNVNVLGLGTCTAKSAQPVAQCATLTDVTYGGTADLWSCTSVSQANVNATTFGASVQTNTSNSASDSVDLVSLIVTYATTTTTTTTTSTTTTTLAGFPVIDTFTRAGPALGANWTQPFGSALTIYNSSVAAASVTTASLVEYWQTNTFASDDSYACVQIGVIGTPTTTVVQAGACIVITTGSDAVCCDANYNVSGIGWQIDYFDNTVYHTGASGASPTVAVGDYIGIHRIDTTHFQCFKATAAAPTTWTDVSGSQVISGIGSNGNPGMYSYIEATNNIQGNDLFEGGVGALPTTHTCGVTTTTTTTTGGTTTTIPPTANRLFWEKG